MIDLYKSCMILPVGGECNLKCSYCYRRKERNGSIKKMPEYILEKFIKEFINYNYDASVLSFGWQGGEPLIAGLDFYKNAIKLENIHNIGNKQITNSIQTNGILIDEDWAKFFRDNNILVGISIDGPSEFHDFLRKDLSGNPTLKRVLRGIDFLRKYDVDFNILCVINRYNAKHAIKIYNFFKKNDFRFIQLIPCIDYDYNSKGLTQYSVSPNDYANFLCMILDEWVKDDDPYVYINIIDILLHSYIKENPPYCFFNKNCDKMLTLNYNGDIYTCDFFVDNKWRLGNIKKDHLSKIFGTSIIAKFRKEMYRISEDCKNCKWYFICHGGCMRYFDFFKNGEEKNFLCDAYKNIFEYYFRLFSSIVKSKSKSKLKSFLYSILKEENKESMR